MAYQVIWSPEALEDIEEIAAYIHKDSPYYAGVVVDHLLDAGNNLSENPARGRIVPELELPDYREVFIYSYRLIYRIGDKTILIVAAIHGNRLFVRAVGERFPDDA